MKPPTLLSLTIDSALLHIAHITDLSAVPDPILVELFLKTLSAGKLTEKVLKLFTATGALKNFRGTVSFHCHTISLRLRELETAKCLEIEENEMGIVITALRPVRTSFLEGWQAIFSRFHLVIIKDSDLKTGLQIPSGFDHHVYTKFDIEGLIGSSPIDFSGHSCHYFGYLISSKKYIISIDDNCLPAKDDSGSPVDAITPHITNLKNPATPFFFNTL